MKKPETHRILVVALLLGLHAAAAAGAAAPGPWRVGGTAPGDYEVTIEPTSGIEGTRCARLRSSAASPDGFVALLRAGAAEPYRGRRIRFTAWIRTEGVDGGGWAGLFMRIEDEDRNVLAFDNMANRPIRGTQPWQQVAVVLDVPVTAHSLEYGLVFEGQGTVWVDEFDIDLVEDDSPSTDLIELLPTPRNLDFEDPRAPGSPP